MSVYPAVSCVCLTYARPHLLEEAMRSFLQREYRGIHELLVLNDSSSKCRVRPSRSAAERIHAVGRANDI
jgi:hypothetical protein